MAQGSIIILMDLIHLCMQFVFSVLFFLSKKHTVNMHHNNVNIKQEVLH